MTVDRILPCVCSGHAPFEDDGSSDGMPILKPSNRLRDHQQYWTVECPKCGRFGPIRYKSVYLALKAWNEYMRSCYNYKCKDTCEKSDYESFELFENDVQ